MQKGIINMFGGKKITTKKGKTITLLNPAQKGIKYSVELRDKIKLSNNGDVKIDEHGGAIVLTDSQAAYRAGYLDARKDSAKAYKHNQKKRK